MPKIFAVRIPESMQLYIRVKAAQEAKTIQEVTSEIIIFYQQHDENFMNQFPTIAQRTETKTAREEVSNGL